MRSERDIAAVLGRLNPVQLYMVHQWFSTEELVIVKNLIDKAASKEGIYRIEDGRFVQVGVEPDPPAPATIPANVPLGDANPHLTDDATTLRAQNLEID